MEDITEKLDMFLAAADLENECCVLKHGDAIERPAVNYLCQNMKDKNTGEIHQLRIPICEECAEALYDPDWILMYCINCNKSQWLYRTKAKLQHPEGNGIYYFDVCPFCAEVEDKRHE